VTTPLRLLIVEDSEDDALLVMQELERSGFEPKALRVQTENELREALAAQAWDCVITDYLLPQFNGLEALAVVSGSGLDLPAILVSGKIGEDLAVAAMRAGAHDYVMKDNLARLGVAVRRELDEAEVRRARRTAEAALRESEARYRAIIEDQTEFVVRWRPDGTRNFVNRAYSDYLGTPREELIGTSFLETMPADDGRLVRGTIAALTPADPIAVVEPRILLPDGKVVWTEWVNRAIFDDQDRMVELQSVGRDITERRLAADAERQQRLLVEVLRDTAAALNSTLDLNEVFDRILANIGWVIPHDTAAIFFVEGRAAKVVRLRGWEERGIEDIPARVPLTGIEADALVRMATRGETIVIQDTSEDQRWRSRDARLEWVRSFAAAPLFDERGLIGVLALFCAEAEYFTPIHLELLEGFASHAGTATRNARLFEAVSAGRRELQRLSSKIVDAQEEERRRISRELHDEVGQALTAVIMNTDFLDTEFADQGPPLAHERLADIANLARATLQQIRDLSLRLRPAMLDELGLVPTLRWFTERFSKRMKIDVQLSIDLEEEDRLDSVVETTLYRCVQEALTNVARHAEASTVEVRLSHADGGVRLVVEDDGAGFDPEPEPRSGGRYPGLGLIGIRERIATLAGSLKIQSEPGGGTRIEVEIEHPQR
jgi:PAS domain S-box-containing protein